MSAITFDTHKFIRELKDADFSEKQAEAMSRVFQQAQGDWNFATKSDIKELELKLDARTMAIEAKIAEAKTDILKWVVGLLLGQTALLLTILHKLLGH